MQGIYKEYKEQKEYKLFKEYKDYKECKNAYMIGWSDWNSALWLVTVLSDCHMTIELPQSNYEITLDNVDCPRAEWESCTFSEDHNCAHSEDVFLRCNIEEEGTTMTTGESWKPTIHFQSRLF